jgi:phytoene synthase
MAENLLASYAHCETLLGHEDRNVWLACLFAPIAARPKLHALGAFAVELGHVRDRVRDPLAGELRLQWWEDAIMGAARGDAAAHPVAAAVIDTIAAAGLPKALLIEAIDAHRAELYDEAPSDLAALDAHLDRRNASVIKLGAAALAGPEVDVAGLAHHAGVALGIVALLRALPRTAGTGQGGIPDALLLRHGLSQADIRAAAVSAPVGAAFADLRRHARDHLYALRLGKRALPEAAAPAFLTVNLVELYLKAGEHRGVDPFAGAAEVAQWRRQWVLWRAAGRGGVL